MKLCSLAIPTLGLALLGLPMLAHADVYSREDYENPVPELPAAMERLDRLGQERFLVQHAPAAEE